MDINEASELSKALAEGSKKHPMTCAPARSVAREGLEGQLYYAVERVVLAIMHETGTMPTARTIEGFFRDIAYPMTIAHEVGRRSSAGKKSPWQ